MVGGFESVFERMPEVRLSIFGCRLRSATKRVCACVYVMWMRIA